MKTLIFAAALLLAPAAHAEEHLVMAPYPAATPWKNITDKHNEVQTLKEWIPADQDENTIKDILTEQIFRNLKGRDPSDFVSDLLRRVAGACAHARVNGPKAGSENGYRVAYAQAYCTNQIGANADVDIFIKAIAGHDALYIVQREFRRPAKPGAMPGIVEFSKDQMAEMNARMKAQGAANDFLVKQVSLKP